MNEYIGYKHTSPGPNDILVSRVLCIPVQGKKEADHYCLQVKDRQIDEGRGGSLD